MRRYLSISLAVAAVGVAACGGDDSDEGSEAAEQAAVTPEKAIAEIGAVRSGIDRAVATYEEGDKAAGAELVGETYLQHFELVEVPLEDADPELNEELEEQIREELAGEMEAGAQASEIEPLVSEIERGLDEAERTLKEAK
jgi:hypothetical protein